MKWSLSGRNEELLARDSAFPWLRIGVLELAESNAQDHVMAIDDASGVPKSKKYLDFQSKNPARTQKKT